MKVEQNSPAAKAGLKESDVIVNFNGNVVNSGDELFRLLNFDRIGISSPLVVVRNQSQLVTMEVFPMEKVA